MKKNTAKRIIILGSTGSIGINALDIIRHNPEKYRAAGLACNNNYQILQKQINEFKPAAAALSGCEKEPGDLAIRGKTDFFTGKEAIRKMLDRTEADMILNGISGAGGLLPSVWSLERGMDIALANKETIVMAGRLIFDLADKNRASIIPVDSEHSAVFHLLNKIEKKDIDEIILTASGGALRDRPLKEFNNITPQQALSHPTWDMGYKITIDSATMANKGLEVIEAMHLFNVPPAAIKVVIHPQSLVHSLVRTKDSALYAHISHPDMRLPIINAFSFPETENSSYGRLNLENIRFDFSAWDPARYPMLSLAYRAADKGESYAIAYNAANELAVNSFYNKNISFPHINEVVEKTLDKTEQININSIADIIETDSASRKTAANIIRSIS